MLEKESLDQENRMELRPGALIFPAKINSIRKTPLDAIDAAIGTCKTHKDEWVQIEILERITLLDQLLHDLMSVGERWVSESMKAKGIPPKSHGEGEEWLAFGTALRAVRLLRGSLADIQKYGRPRIPGSVYTRPDGQVVAQVFPQTWTERMFFQGVIGEVWMQPSVTTEDMFQSQANIYQEKSHEGNIAVVLAAGNAATLSVVDFLYKLFVQDRVVILKTNPVNAYLGPIFEEGFQALICRGFLQIVYGGAEEGLYLCNHPDVGEIHLTGSDKTYEAIVFGDTQDAAIRKRDQNPINTKPITAELGNVTPVIVVPGPWEEDYLMEQAVQIASSFVSNASFNCLTPRLIIQHSTWSQRDALNDAIGEVLKGIKTRRAYYPGAEERYALFLEEHPDARQYGETEDGHLPWTYITDVDPNNSDDICFKCESFCSVFAETGLEASSVPEFVDQAVEFANNTLWGTLVATILVHPKSLQDPKVASALDRALSRLRYGTICVNQRTEVAWYLMLTTWGAFPGHKMGDIQSGRGVVNNLLMFNHPQKSVVQSHIIGRPDPLTVRSQSLHELGKKVASFEASPSLWKLPGLFWQTIRS